MSVVLRVGALVLLMVGTVASGSLAEPGLVRLAEPVLVRLAETGMPNERAPLGNISGLRYSR